MPEYISPSPEQAVDGVTLPEGEVEAVALLMKIMTRLRAPDGCPWDRAQTHESLLPNLLEEAYEYFATVKDGDTAGMREELGDLLLQVIFHAQIAAEEGKFTLGQSARELAVKLVRRHPHVFGDTRAGSADGAIESWNSAKQKEGLHTLHLENIPRAMPALLRARKIQEKAARVGFEWREIEGALAKVDEELGELKHAMAANDGVEDELGDLLFAVVNVARYLKLCPETALTATNDKFLRRFRYIEQQLLAQGKTLQQATLEEMDGYWEEAKKM